MAELTRNQLREKVVDALYSSIIQEVANIDYDPEQIFDGIFNVESFGEADIFAQEVYVQALKNKDEIIALVQPKLNKWTFKRLNTIAQAIFLESISECKYAKYTTKPVAINCAVDLAKRYLDSKDYKYINAVLDKVL